MPRPLNFQQIEAFRAVMDTGTTTGAATMLNTSQPAISRRLAELRRATQLTLFDLHNGRLRPTTEGRHLYKAILRHFAGLQKIEAIVASIRESGTQTLRLGCTPTLAVGLIPRVIHDFLARFPNTHINIQTMGTPQLADYLHQDLLDIAVATGEFRRDDFQPQVLNRTAAVCVLPRGHRLAEVESVELSMLKGERILSFSDTDELSVRIKQQLLTHGIPDYFSIQTPSSMTVCALVAAGNGVGIVTPYVADLFGERLLIKPLMPTIGIDLQLALPDHTAPSLLVRHFRTVLVERLG